MHKVHNLLSLVLEMAVKDRRLSRSVARGVNLPRVAKHEHLYLTHEQVEALANECGFPADPSRHATYDTLTNAMYRLVVLFLAYTGVRFGEVAALKAARLDLRRSRAMTVESVTPIAGGHLFGDRLDEVPAAMARRPRGGPATPERAARVARDVPVLPEPDLSRSDEAAPHSVSADQDRFD